MARTGRRALAQAEPQQESLVASATRLPGTPTLDSITGRGGQPWQEECWGHYRAIGEYHFAINWLGSMLSRARLFAAKYDENGHPKRVDGAAAEWMRAFFKGPEGQAEMLKQVGIHLGVAGECYLIAYEDPNDRDEQWHVVAPSKVRKVGGVWRIGRQDLPTSTLMIRLWLPDPVEPGQPISPSRAALPILREIERLTLHAEAQQQSRLISAGILLMPQEMTFSTPPVNTPEEEKDTSTLSAADRMTRALVTAARAAIRDRGSASALVPIVITAPGEHIASIQHLTFWSDLDENALAMREALIKRLALAMDIPPEVMLGVADSNHWSAWQVDESSVKAHAEPALALITAGLSKAYLRPLLRQEDKMDEDEALDHLVVADTSEMRLRPNRSKEALELYDRGELAGAPLRRETGFQQDGPEGGKDMQRWLALQIVTGKASASPNQVAVAAKLLGLDLPMEAGDERVPQGVLDRPSLEEHPTRDVPEEVDPALLAAAEGLVLRALERAGNRMRTRKIVAKAEGVAAADCYIDAPPGKELPLDFLLEDAWTYTARCTAHMSVDPEEVADALDLYCRGLLAARRPHRRNYLRAHLALTLSGGRTP